MMTSIAILFTVNRRCVAFSTNRGALNRRALRAHVAKHPEARAILEQITHPRIRNRIETWFAHQQAQGARAAVVEAALLFETGSAPAYDKIPPALSVAIQRPPSLWLPLP